MASTANKVKISNSRLRFGERTAIYAMSVIDMSPKPRATALYDILFLVLATAGVLMLCFAFRDWLVHSLTLWTMAH